MAYPNRISNKYEFSNKGTLYSFDPNKTIFDNLNGGQKISLLELHMNLVKHYDSKDVFIIDSKGNIINPDGSFLPYQVKTDKDKSNKNTRRSR